LKADTLSHFNITKDIRVIPNFIDASRFKKQKKDHFKMAICPNGEKLLVHTSNFRKVKRVEDVLAIFGGVRKKIPAKLLLVGDGPERVRMEQICREMNACNDIRFLGKLDVVEEVLSVSDLFIMPSEKESFGLAALEAMACEVPLISTNTGGLPELNIQGKTGFLSDVGDVEDMIKNALFILKDENLSEFKKNALKRAKEFEGEAILPQYIDYYEYCLNNQYKMV
ncbi:MAG TPA: N-acetyl-alpha-D-glucosaminyl L-malate synthase BshA, partial [Cytophagaceae bacterium]|nr:N-acetyl-alpha-D-glucosaminyl L-malate synthase BshA [Cytophagaceae bacterium]